MFTAAKRKTERRSRQRGFSINQPTISRSKLQVYVKKSAKSNQIKSNQSINQIQPKHIKILSQNAPLSSAYRLCCDRTRGSFDVDLCGDTEINQFDLPRFGENEIRRLEVAMHDSGLVHRRHAAV